MKRGNKKSESETTASFTLKSRGFIDFIPDLSEHYEGILNINMEMESSVGQR
jgi:hypothetical protein